LSINQALPDPLSPRELEVLALIADGYTNREIADQLHVGVSTVKKHINHIYSKLAVVDRAGAVNCARASHLIL
jgi:ATP/maltotriose-dependent transcriptional regulator MalT